MYQFCKRLVSKGTKATLAITPYISKSTSLKSDTVAIETISGGYAQASSIEEYLALMEAAGSKTLAELIQKHAKSNNPIDCIVYDSFLPWILAFLEPHHGLLTAAYRDSWIASA
ncbi:UDP-glycosyltransferase 74F2 [Forsythia ovata]|uniref:UDP-glycosyltransferase 74F2 n=1 Tax=Forsythia ovata TaxID=205694 RepID=A0ABD1RHI3_9LAMI